MDKKLQSQYVYLYREIQRLTKEISSKFVKKNKDILIMKLEEILPLYEEKNKIKELDYKSKQGLEFVRKELDSLKSAQAKGWDKKTYRKLQKRSKSHENLTQAVGFNPLSLLHKKK